MIFEKTVFEDVWIIKPEAKSDERGYFERIYSPNEFKNHNIDFSIVQVSRSFNIKKGTIRGLHFQKKPKEEKKLIQVISGKIMDVVVDIRKDSSTFGKHINIILSAEKQQMIFIPKGFAHGYQTLVPNCELIYFISQKFDPDYYAGINYADPNLLITWPIANPLVSEKDRSLPILIS